MKTERYESLHTLFRLVKLSCLLILSVLDGYNKSTSSDMCTKSSGGDDRGGGGGDEHKTYTSYEQNVEHCKKDASDVDDIVDGIGKVDVSDKDTDKYSTDKKHAGAKEDKKQCVFADDVQEYISSYYSEKRNTIGNAFKELELSDYEGLSSDPKKAAYFNEVQAATFKSINEEEIKNKKLFQDPPPKEDCSICMLPMPFAGELDGRFRFDYQCCCGKRVCSGCIDAAKVEIRKGKMKDLCPLCREPRTPTFKEDMKRCKKRMKLKDAHAFYVMGDQYYNGRWGLPQHLSKACELWKQAAELGSVHAHCGLGDAYSRGAGVEQDGKKARYHFEIAAMGGHENARHALGSIEEVSGNRRLGMYHVMFAARSGYELSMKAVGEAYKIGEEYKVGYVTKDEYAATLRAYKESYDEMESVHRAASAAAREPMARDPYAMSPEDRAACIEEYKGAFTRSEK